MKARHFIFLFFLAFPHALLSEKEETLAESLPAFTEKDNPTNLGKVWEGWNPAYEPLEVETLHEWEEEDVILKVVRYRVGVFKGEKVMMAGIYGYPKGGGKSPGLLQIHGGGQYADSNAVLTNAKRGYATFSIAWAGRINAPEYRVSPAEVKLFWEGKTEDPRYKVTTDWGALDAYHAPSRNGKDAFKSVVAEDWTIDAFPSGRNISWFPITMATRRAITFLQEQKEVDKNRIGVYGHSMGGKLTVMTAGLDWRVTAAVPSCGGVSDRYSENPIYAETTHDSLYLPRITCPILFLNPVNDFHAHFSDFQTVHEEIRSKEWRYSFSPQLNHTDIPEHMVATHLWFDHFLKFKSRTPKTPKTELKMDAELGVPILSTTPDASLPIQSIDVYYTQQGVRGEMKNREERTGRYWHHARTTQEFGKWSASLPINDPEKPLWAYVNVTYKLPEAVAGAGYYYEDYQTETFTLSSKPHILTAEELKAAGIKGSLTPSLQIETFQGNWEKGWYKRKAGDRWQKATHKVGSTLWEAPEGAELALEVHSDSANALLVGLDDHWAEVELSGGAETIMLPASAFQKGEGTSLPSFSGITTLALADTVRLKVKGKKEQQVIGRPWEGGDPVFKNLRWETPAGGEGVTGTETLNNAPAYKWTTDHMHVGVRWQPHAGLPELNKADFQRDVLSENSSYVQLWVSWSAVENQEENQNYKENPSNELKNIEQAVTLCNQAGKKVELVFYHCPAWASESGVAGGEKPKDGYFPAFIKRFSTYFKGRVHAYQLYHEANLDDMMKGASAEFLINEFFTKGAETIREVYGDTPVLVSTSGMSPCIFCSPVEGLGEEMGDTAISNFYDLMISDEKLMGLVDALNMNVSDQNDGYGGMNGLYINSTWDNYDLVRGKLDAAGYPHIPVISSESWITWDGAANTTYDVDRNGEKNEQDAYQKCLTIMGQCLERGLNTMNFPWSDNSSSWAMGLTKRIDYNGEVSAQDPSLTYPSLSGGPDVITQKLGLSRNEDGTLSLRPGRGEVFTVDDYAVPGDPNHLHYYIWKWYSQISGGSDEVIRHAVAGEKGNDISVGGPAYSGSERYRISSYNRTRKEFKVLLYGNGCSGEGWSMFTLPAQIQTGRHYHTGKSQVDFRGEGLTDGTVFTALVETKDISRETGRDLKVSSVARSGTVKDGKIYFVLPALQPFTTITIKAAE